MSSGWLKLAVAVVIAAVLSACVTTETGGFEDKKDPKKAVEYLVQAARGYIQQGTWEAAKRHLKSALDIDSQNPDANEALALVFWRTGEFEQADKYFREAVSDASGSDVSRIRNNYAAYLYDRQRYGDAEGQLEKVAEDLLYDKRPEAFLNLGMVRVKLKKYAQAKDVLERAALMDRNNPLVMFQLAEVYYQLEQYTKAQNYYDAFRQRVQTPSAASLWLGIRLADRAGDKDSAASYALALKNLFPQSEEYLAYKSVYGNAGTEH
ncbi:MAG TPA: type IV pilus biogenesis/stability protein PilW [Spongiibacteraceae bacterium]|nr:type IV pilus biogenesis/stability protein PilW [Spongiibacteraceae bacterium]